MDNEKSQVALYICIAHDSHDCKDEDAVSQLNDSLEELIQKREVLKVALLQKDLLTEEEFQDWFGVYTRANYDY